MRLGILSFSTELIERDEEEIAEALSQMKFMPYRVEHLLHTRSLEMIGTSYMFEDIGDNMKPVKYTIELTRTEDGGIIVNDVIKEKT